MSYKNCGVLTGILCITSGLLGFGQKTLFVPRSQALFSPLEAAGWQRLIYKPDRESTSATVSVAPAYMHSFWPNDITKFLFGCPELIFSGSQVIGRNATDILADYWGLPSDYESVVQFKPLIVNFLMDFNCHISLDGWVQGLFAEVHLPIVHSKWDLQLVECITDAGTTFTSYPAGYLSADPIELTELNSGDGAPKNVMHAFRGKSVFGDMREPLMFGTIFGRQNETRVSELWMTLGYNFLLTEQAHFGVSLRAAAPTGTLRSGKFLFEPIIGNDHHWELGTRVSGHFDFWRNAKEDKSLGFWMDAHFSHMFGSTQKRSYDLKNNGNGSRYMLLEKMAEPVVALNNGLSPDNTAATIQYQGRLVPAINKTTLDTKISVGLQADVLAKLNFKRRGFECEIGYNLWARSSETIESRDCVETCYAIKGDAQVYGFTSSGETPVALAATQSNATINGGQPVTDSAFPNLNDGNFNTGVEFANINADTIANASDNLGASLNQLTLADANRLDFSQVAVRTSNPAILITNDDINCGSALLPKAISHTLFFSLSYAIEEGLDLIPFIGGGGFIEFAHADPCNNSANAQWGLWLKMGLSFS